MGGAPDEAYIKEVRLGTACSPKIEASNSEKTTDLVKLQQHYLLKTDCKF